MEGYQAKPIQVGKEWFYEGTAIPQAQAQQMLGIQPAPVPQQVNPQGLAAQAAAQNQARRRNMYNNAMAQQQSRQNQYSNGLAGMFGL